MDKILTIIVTYNGIKWLEECISSVKNSNAPSDIFIIDNGSSDGSIKYIKENVPNAIFIESKDNLGFGRANNIGLKFAVENGYDYVYLLNQDAWLEKDTLFKLISASKSYPEYGILSPLQTNREKNRLDHNFSLWCPRELFSDLLCSQPIKDIYPIDFVMAAHWLIPIKALKKTGGFSPAFRHYGEDDNLIHRMQCNGYKIGIVPSSIGIHDREYRPFPKDKKDYIRYVRTLIMLNNPLVPHPLISLIKKNVKILFHPSKIVWKYYFYSFMDYIKSIKYKKEYKGLMPFIN